jgi:hypothetical protein
MTPKKNVLLYAKEVFALNGQNEFGKPRKTEEDPSKFLFLDFNKSGVSLGINALGRRLVVRWERRKVYFDAFIDLATIHIWINKILLVG